MANKPKANPNAKHTLDDVLKALQDLVRNELAEGGKTPAADANAEAESVDAAASLDAETDPSLTLEEAVAQLLDEPTDDLGVDAPPEAASTDVAPPPPAAPATAKTKTVPEQTSINWDDIPVLNDVVVPPIVDAAAPLPPPARARELAVRVIAKLNIELRKAGNTPLDPTMIDRLEHLLREALEIAAAKPENPPPS